MELGAPCEHLLPTLGWISVCTCSSIPQYRGTEWREGTGAWVWLLWNTGKRKCMHDVCSKEFRRKVQLIRPTHRGCAQCCVLMQLVCGTACPRHWPVMCATCLIPITNNSTLLGAPSLSGTQLHVHVQLGNALESYPRICLCMCF